MSMSIIPEEGKNQTYERVQKALGL